MTVVKSAETTDASLSSQWLYAARYYLGNWRALLILGGVVLLAIIGVNWRWLVAVGLAPILLSTLPCLVMCAFGVCAMCRSGEKKSAATRESVDEVTTRAALGVTRIDAATVAGSGCCHEEDGEPQSPNVKQTQSIEERKVSNV